MQRYVRPLAGVLLLIAAACGQELRLTVPSPPDAELSRQVVPLRFVHRDGQAPPFARETLELRAVAGSSGEVVARFVDGSPVATFRLLSGSLEGARLGDRLIQSGDSVVITMRLVDGARYMVDLQPSGIVFNPESPAELVFHYRHASQAARNGKLAVWKQEREGSPWQHLGGSNDPESRSFHVEVDGFTRFAMSH
jgi:hypothetical protein